MINLEEYSQHHAADLSHILAADNILKDQISSTFSGPESIFHKETINWISKKSSFTYSVLHQNVSIGLASIVPDSSAPTHCSIGYWLGSTFWNQGFGSQMFAQLLSLASSKHFSLASALIANSNIPSLRLWLKYSPTVEPVGHNKSLYKITLPNKAVHTEPLLPAAPEVR